MKFTITNAKVLQNTQQLTIVESFSHDIITRLLFISRIIPIVFETQCETRFCAQ